MSPVNLIPLVYQAVTWMDRWMRDVVRGHRGFSKEERQSFAVELSYHLGLGSCPCGLACCSRRHTIASYDPAAIGLPLFVEEAVIGPCGLQANSVSQGMLYRLILRGEYGMLVALVELKRCAEERCPMKVYEEERCPGDRCSSVYTPDETEVVAQERLLIQGVYQWVRRWCCKKKGHPGEHYFRQRLCRDEMRVVHVDDPERPGEVVPVVRHRVVHDPDGGHDSCPWCGCPHGKPRHSQRGTTLWVRSELAGRRPPADFPSDPGDPVDPTDPESALRLAAFEEGVRDWWDALDQATRDTLQADFARELSPDPAPDGDPLRIADWLLDVRPSAMSSQMKPLREAIQRSFAARGLKSGPSPYPE